MRMDAGRTMLVLALVGSLLAAAVRQRAASPSDLTALPTAEARAAVLRAGREADVGAINWILPALDTPELRRDALWAIGEIGPPAEAAIPAVVALSGSDDALTRLRVATTLVKLAPTSASHREVWERLAADPVPLVAWVARGLRPQD